jgi:hypothetical protein
MIMKLTVPFEDLIVGIICGILLVGYTGNYFSLQLNDMVYVIAFIIYLIFIALDIAYEFSDLTTHFGFIVFSLCHNFVDLVLSLGIISKFGGWDIPYITSYLVPYLQPETYLFAAGAYIIIGNAIWFVLYPFSY